MAVKISVGGENFETLRKNGSYYVDKTELLYELVQQKNNAVTLFTCPRRFGKTLMMRMMESFFDICKDSKALFEGLAITKHEHFCREWMNQYPVLMVSFKDVAGLNFEDAYGLLKDALADAFRVHEYLLNSPQADLYEKETFSRLLKKEATMAEVKFSLYTATRMLHTYYGKPVILLIDEYDSSMIKACEGKDRGERYYPQMLDMMRGVLGTSLKGNDHLKFGVLTSSLDIPVGCMIDSLNQIVPYSVLDRPFSHSFGFTQNEIDCLLEEAQLTDRHDEIKNRCGGYVIGDTPLYCPQGVMNYLANAVENHEQIWGNNLESAYSGRILVEFLSRSEFDVSDKFETLMNGGTITQTISDSLTYDSLHDTEDNLWSVLLMTGYLTKADPNAQGETVALRIPNQEVLSIFQDTVVRLFRDTLDRSRQQDLMNALWSGNAERSSELLSDFLWETISFHDYHENYYHAFLTGIFVGMGYAVRSNQEQGLGCSDITVLDKKNRRAMVIEAKRSASEAQMEQDCDATLAQIEEKPYGDALYGYRTILRYGVAFYKKSAMVKKG